MTNTKKTKRALLGSVIALILCLSMLVGTTFAWFTDSVVSGKNHIVAGNLDIELEYLVDGKWVAVDEQTNIFGNSLWEPGHTEVVTLKISNVGSLALKYQMGINVIDEITSINVADEELKLSDHIEFGIVDGQYTDRAAARAAVTNAAKISEGYAEEEMSLLPGGSKEITLVVYMPESVSNEANHKTGEVAPEIWLGINLMATQLMYEEDSFDNTYDENAAFGTYVVLNAGENLLDVMKSAEAGKPLTIKLNSDVEWPTEGHHGENDITPATAIVIDGNGHTITATGSGVTPLGDTEAPMTLKNVKIVDKSASYAEDAWEFTYLELGGTSLTCDNVTFADEIQIGTNATFTNCSFLSNEANVYAVWVEDGSAAFNNCTFTGYRGLKAHEDYGTEISSVVVKNCTFSDITKKPGIALGTLNADTTVSITGSTFINCQAGDQSKYIYETDTDVTTFNFVNENNTVLNNISEVVEIATKADLFAFAQRVNGGDSMNKKLVVLTADIDLENELWTPVGQTGATQFTGIFDGQGHTIKNLNVDSSAQTGEHYSSGLFGWVEGKVTIKNVNIDGATVKGNHNVAALLGYTYSAQISNCHVSNATIVCNHANGDACGDKAGTIVGYAGDESRFTNCSASDSTVTAGRDAGQLIGTGYNVSVSNCTATNVTVAATGDCNKEGNINNAIIGRVMG